MPRRDDDRDGRPAGFRLGWTPFGAARIAFSYLGSLIALVIATLLAVMVRPVSDAVCAGVEDPRCVVGWEYASVGISALVGLVAPAFVLRLGWEWWLVAASVLWSSPLWTPLAPAWAPWVVGLLTPAIAGAATWNGDERSRWRPVVIAAMGVLTLAALAFVLFVPE